MAVTSRTQLKQLIDELPEDDLASAQTALKRILHKQSASTRSQRQQELLDAGLLVSAASGMTSEEFWSYKPPKIRGEMLSDTVIKNRR